MSSRWLVLWIALPLWAQSETEWKSVLERLNRLEQENIQLKEKVQSLGEQIARIQPVQISPESESARLEERVDVNEQRIAEQAQTKVEGSQRFPVRLSGMVLFNTSYNTANNGGQDTVVAAAPVAGRGTYGATFRQSIIGLEYRGPATLWGGRVSSSLFMDFYNGLSEPFYSYARVRTANISLAWNSRSVTFGLEKPIFNPREPTSLAQVGISPLTGSGNLWRWQPQVRFEQRVRLGKSTEFRMQSGFLQTSEDVGYAQNANIPSLVRRRPSIEGRFELAHRIDDTRRIEFAPGFHYSTTKVVGSTVPSSLVSLDWFANPWSKLEFSGAFFSGQNVAHFGALRQGFEIFDEGDVEPVHARGGWGQFTFRATDRLSFNAYAGIHDDRDSDLHYGQRIGQNRSGAVNMIYRLAPNVLWSVEALQIRTFYLNSGWRLNNRYDMAVAYQF